MSTSDSTPAPERWTDMTPGSVGFPVVEGYQVSDRGRPRPGWNDDYDLAGASL